MRHAAGRCRSSGVDESGGRPAAAVRLPAHSRDARAPGDRDEPEDAMALYREEKPQVRRRAQARLGNAAADAGAGGTERALVPEAPNVRWCLDLVSDALTGGRRFRILAVVDDGSREGPALVADTSLSGRRVVRELEALIARRGASGHDRF